MKRVAGLLLGASVLQGCASPSTNMPHMGMSPAPPVLRGAVGPWGEPVVAKPPVGPYAMGSFRGVGPEVPRMGGPTQHTTAYPPMGAGPGAMPGMPGMPPPPMAGMPGMPPPPGMPGAMAMGPTGGAGGLALGHFHPGAPPPVPSMPQGSVLAKGAYMCNAGNTPFAAQRSQIRFVGPAGAKISWLTQGNFGGGMAGVPQVLDVPGRYNFLQASIYRLRLSDIPGRQGLELYPTLEVVPSNPRTENFLAHSPIPIDFTEEDFDQVTAGNFLTKVIYLPDSRFQAPEGRGPEELVSTRLDPGMDPIAEAYRRGHILLIIRLGGIDLATPNSPSMDAPGGGAPAVPGPGHPHSNQMGPNTGLANQMHRGQPLPPTFGSPGGPGRLPATLPGVPSASPTSLPPIGPTNPARVVPGGPILPGAGATSGQATPPLSLPPINRPGSGAPPAPPLGVNKPQLDLPPAPTAPSAPASSSKTTAPKKSFLGRLFE